MRDIITCRTTPNSKLFWAGQEKIMLTSLLLLPSSAYIECTGRRRSLLNIKVSRILPATIGSKSAVTASSQRKKTSKVRSRLPASSLTQALPTGRTWLEATETTRPKWSQTAPHGQGNQAQETLHWTSLQVRCPSSDARRQGSSPNRC